MRGRDYRDVESSHEEIQNLLSDRDKEFANLPLALDEDYAHSKDVQLGTDFSTGDSESITNETRSCQSGTINHMLRGENENGDMVSVVANRQTEKFEHIAETNQTWKAISDSEEYNVPKQLNLPKNDAFEERENPLDEQEHNVTSEQVHYDVDDLTALDALLETS